MQSSILDSLQQILGQLQSKDIGTLNFEELQVESQNIEVCPNNFLIELKVYKIISFKILS